MPGALDVGCSVAWECTMTLTSVNVQMSSMQQFGASCLTGKLTAVTEANAFLTADLI